jgi:hypothetical protein
MKTDKISKRLWILSVIFIISLFIHIGIQHRKLNRLSKQNQLQQIELNTLKDSVSVYENKNGDLTYKLSIIEVSHSNLKESLDKAGFEIKDLKQRDINWRKITTALRAQIAATGHVQTDIKPDTFRIENTDTIYFSAVDPWSNNYLSIFNGEIVNKKLSFDYSYTTSISIIPTAGRKGTIVNVFLTDPKAQITSASSITVKHEKKIWERGWLWGLVGLGVGVLIAR